MVLNWLLSAATQPALPVVDAFRHALFAPHDRRTWEADTRTHVEVRGIHKSGTTTAAEAMRGHLADLDGVHSVEINAAYGRVVVTHAPGVVSPAQLAKLIGELEHEHHLQHSAIAPASAEHPGNADVIVREIGTLVANATGLGYVALTWLLPVRTLPALIPATVSLIDSVPWIRTKLESGLGKPATDTALAAASTLAQTMARNPMSLTTSACQRLLTSREVITRNLAWRQWEQSVADRPGVHETAPFEVSQRPRPLPDGPNERIANASGALAAVGYPAALAATGSPQRAQATLQAGIPRACTSAREGFATQLGTVLSTRGNVIFDRRALRRLDKLDAVLFDADTLLTGRYTVEEVYLVDGDTVPTLDGETAVATLFARAHELIDPHHPEVSTRHGQWASHPVIDFADQLGAYANTIQDQRLRGGTVAVLAHESKPVALVTIVPELDARTEALIAAAREARVAVAATGPHLRYRLGLDGIVAAPETTEIGPSEDSEADGSRTLESVRQLQRDGHVVALVSARRHEALAAADIGIGVVSSGKIPWGCHIQCPQLSEVHSVLAAAVNARRASGYGATLSMAGSCLGIVFSAIGPRSGASARASIPVNAAAVAGLGVGVREGVRAGERPPPAGAKHTPWHAIPADAVVDLVASAPGGLSEPEALRRPTPSDPDRAKHGIARDTLHGLANPLTPVLGAGAVVAASLGSTVDAAMIVTVLVAGALVDAVQSATTANQLARLLDSGELRANVRRANTTTSVPAGQLVVGDVIELQAGDGVPADCRVLETEGLEADEASLTGESQLVAKGAQAITAATIADRTSMLYHGTVVTTGQATAVVVAAGMDTEIGRTVHGNGGPPRESSGVAQRLNALTRQTLPLSAGAGVALLLVDLLRGSPIGSATSRAVGLAVAAVPEGLPFVATVAELAAARRLSSHGVLVRSPSTIEALGRVDALCFDKTGTLTQGRIGLRYVCDGVNGATPDQLTPGLREILRTGVQASPRRQLDRPLAHPTDRAVLDGADTAGLGEEVASEPVAELPFEPSRGFHAVAVAGHDGMTMSVKGAPEVVLERCARWAQHDGHRSFDTRSRAELDERIQRLAQAGYRVLAVAQRNAGELKPSGGNGLEDSDVDELDFVGLLALADPVQPTAAASVASLQRGGVSVIMITGDHPSTAEAVAAELDMLGDRRVMHGTELDAIDDDELAEQLPGIAVFARVSPDQKARIVRQLRNTGRVVAMTGDGANDVPAIRLAHVGIAAGQRATPAARECADLVIADERIETITHALIEGRGMWASVHDALSVLLGGNLGEIGYSLGAGLMGSSSALNARQLLVVNLLTDVLPALAIAVRPPPGLTSERLLAEGPEASLGTALNRDVYARATATAGAAAVAWALARPLATTGQARTTGLVALVAAQLGQTLAVRGSTPLVLAASAVSLLILAGLVQLPGVSQLFGSQPLLPHQWAMALGAAAAATLAVRLWQVWQRRNSPAFTQGADAQAGQLTGSL